MLSFSIWWRYRGNRLAEAANRARLQCPHGVSKLKACRECCSDLAEPKPKAVHISEKRPFKPEDYPIQCCYDCQKWRGSHNLYEPCVHTEPLDDKIRKSFIEMLEKMRSPMIVMPEPAMEFIRVLVDVETHQAGDGRRATVTVEYPDCLEEDDAVNVKEDLSKRCGRELCRLSDRLWYLVEEDMYASHEKRSHTFRRTYVEGNK
jgi:hypothetical protein